MPNEPDDLTFAELRLVNLLVDRSRSPINLQSGNEGSVGAVLASMVIHADFLAAAHSIDLAAEIRKQFAPQRLENWK